MYILNFAFRKTQIRQDPGFQVFSFTGNNAKNNIPKWTVLQSTKENEHLIKMLVLVSCGIRFIPHIPYDLRRFYAAKHYPFQVEAIIAPHPYYRKEKLPRFIGCGIKVERNGKAQMIKREEGFFLPKNILVRNPGILNKNYAYFLLAYGNKPVPHNKTDDFNFTNPFYQVTRYYSLFNTRSLLTDPVAFLTRLQYKSAFLSRYPAVQVMQLLKGLLKQYLDIDTNQWLSRQCNFSIEWKKLEIWQQRVMLPILDAIRHLIDTFPRSGKPFEMPRS